jgi:hypothetical protein
MALRVSAYGPRAKEGLAASCRADWRFLFSADIGLIAFSRLATGTLPEFRKEKPFEICAAVAKTQVVIDVFGGMARR